MVVKREFDAGDIISIFRSFKPILIKKECKELISKMISCQKVKR